MKKHKILSTHGLFFCLALILSIAAPALGQSDDALLERAKTAIEKNDYEAALRDLNAILSREPSNEAALTQRARAYVRQEKDYLAFTDAEAVLRSNPNNTDALNVRGIVKNRRKDYDGAIADFDRVLALDAKFAKAYRNRAVAKANKKASFQEIGKDYDAYIRLVPTDASAYKDAGDYCLSLNGAYPTCAAYFESYKRLMPDSFIGYYGYALAFANNYKSVSDKTKLTGEIVQNFRRAAELEPKNKNIPLQLGRLLLNLDDYDGSIAALTAALALDPKDAWAYAMRGDDHRLKKDYDRALADYTKAIEIDPNYPGAYKFRAKTAWEKLVKTNMPYQTEAEKAFYEQTYNDFKKWAELSEQDYEAYKELSRFSTNFARYAAAEQKNPTLQAQIETQTGNFYKSLIAANAANVCARYFLLESSNYFGKNQGEWNDLIDKYDGKRGGQCASDAALWIGRNYAEGDQYLGISPDYDKARALYDLALKFNPQAEYVAAWKEKLPQPLKVISSGTINSSTSSSNSSSTPSRDETRVRAALEEYERVHASIEKDIENYNNAMEKYNKAGEAQYLYKGTYGRALRALDSAALKIEQFLDRHGKYLPKELYDHIVSDYRKVGGVRNY